MNWPVLIVIIIGTFMAILDGTIVNVALPKMMTVFGAATDEAQWIVTAYMLCLGVIMPLSGYLGDRFGYKCMYSMALLVFVIGSTLCGLAWNLPSMVAARVLQALGGGLMQPLGMAILYQNFPRERIGMVLGFWGIAIAAAPAVGPTLGGYLVDYASWRLIFFINVPLGLLNLVLAFRILKETYLLKIEHLDVKGVIASSIGFFCLLLAISQGNNEGWRSPYIVILFGIAFTSLAFFVANELRHPEPILELRLFRNPIFVLSVIISCIISIGMYAVMFMIPIMLQSVLGLSAMQTGIIMFPAALTSGAMMPISGRIFDRFGARGTVLFGLAILVVTTYVIGTFSALTTFAAMTLWLAIRGLGMGFSFMPTNTAGMNTVPQALVGRASALNNVLRQIASAFGIAMFTTIMQNRQAFHFASLAESVNSSSPDYQNLLLAMNNLSSSIGMGANGGSSFILSMLSSQIVKASMVQAINDCFLVATALCLLAWFLAWGFGRKKPATG